ncbi:hypothetical protein M409DRAFT_37044 [Zasmidium cellare ATCC 36951]|uniref:Cercosporin MFS transporter CTB4 n=1 Tax=Zasmidium cellare ATCC 36951 TaxID=1080233 RepID=A0A6A6CEE9_ZASCE|nr:uncharacterized protein M409DRAFT_37044 [Zasmidium cellare ATCC 36951]KAF2164538.1 hypothetical protein M409DRAFT_37044 [Zasmidium cellare ATCC 36951]
MDTVDRDLEAAEWDAQQDVASHSPGAKTLHEGVQQTTNGRPVENLIKARTTGSHYSHLNRPATRRLQHQYTVGSYRDPVPREDWPTFGDRRPCPPAIDNESYVVEFTGHDDPMHPFNWVVRKKLVIAVILSYCTLTASFASAIFSSAVDAAGHHFHISVEVATLGVSLYVTGFAAGPTLWAPLSELKRRRLPLLIGMFGYSVFTIGSATCKDTQTLMLTRFFAGFFGASPLSIVPACFADMFDNAQRGIAITAFAMAVFVGPFLSPIIGGFITISSIHWRWTMYISAIMGFLGLIGLVFFVPESYPPAILVAKAQALRKATRNWAIHSKQDEVEVDFHQLITNNFSRPIRMLATEPLVLLVTLYMSFIYGLMYALLGAYPIVFEGVHGMGEGVGSLPFLGLIVGEAAGGLYIICLQKGYVKKLEANNDQPIPEWRLPPAIIGGVVFTIGIFWFGWTGFSSSIHWMAPTASGVFIGFGILCIFLQCFNYLIDSYISFAASVFAANTILRSLVGAGFPLFTRQMFDNLGIQWAGTLLGCLSAIMVPIPLAFIIFGPRLRKRSKFGEPDHSPDEAEAKDIEKPDVDET